eukprot:3390013-Prorocentrum_lima.AAC.1
MEPKMVNGVYLGPTLRVRSKFNKASHVARLDAFRGADLRSWTEFDNDVYIDISEELYRDVGEE